MKKSDAIIFNYLYNKCKSQHNLDKSDIIGCTTKEIAEALKLQRTNVSAALNRLCEEGKILKIKGKPVIYTINSSCEKSNIQILKQNNFKVNRSFDNIIGANKSLKKCIQQAKAAILYPPNGLHTLLLGPTGVGKTMFAELMYNFAIEKGVIKSNAPFVSFNCADYANNPQLLLAHLFGSKKGAFTGADRDKIGLVDKANGGILFLDEIHRLPPEGQEMLFMLIDKGVYTPLGDIENKKTSKVLIISATTEDVGSSLLNTFTRRIPMTISIPPLKDRTLEERFELICEFFKIESKRIGKEITVSTNTIRSLLLYNCSGNIGQLKSDIQLGCANAFLKFVSKGQKKIEVYSTDFSNNVRQGLVLYKQYSKSIDKIIKEDAKLTFNSKGTKLKMEHTDTSLPDNFYESIEKRIQELKNRGVEEDDINFTISFDIKNYFNKYIKKFEQKVNKEELSKIVDNNIINIVEDFLKIASQELKRIFPTKVFYGLCLHINSSIERILNNKNIINHNLAEIIQKHGQEYGLALTLANKLEEKFNIKIPADEIGFLAMFLCVDSENEENINNKPIIVIAMHGRNTASSMAEVTNKLVGGNNVFAYDMNLDKKPQEAYREIKNLIITNHQGAGVILLVDMGSLSMFGELIAEETGINIKVMDMVSTLLAIECARKALTNNNIEEICKEVKQSINFINNYSMSIKENYIPSKDNIIITTCITGEGSAIKLKNIIEEKINLNEKDIQVVAISASDKKEMYNTINILSKGKKIIAIVGTVNPDIYGIPYISTSEIFLDSNYTRLKNIVNRIKTPKDFYKDIFEGLEKEMTDFNIREFEPLCIRFIDKIKETITNDLDIYIVSGLILHLACAIVRLINKENVNKCSRLDEIINIYSNEYINLKTALKEIENFYNINFSEDEICYILMIILGI
ncbi:sigma 54-interacting transcriptional regulator [Clostridium prolinivorans]|uniref:sigma 54-interacting transcriptional regulator n=1 Tax=Clostridium prolinivorans TaxID=2769420 RepID=UPI000FDC4C81|nr:sigma-54-dependent transcriptional regulator [Clostridium prolinivorans]